MRFPDTAHQDNRNAQSSELISPKFRMRLIIAWILLIILPVNIRRRSEPLVLLVLRELFIFGCK